MYGRPVHVGCSKREIKAKRKSARTEEEIAAKRQKSDETGMCFFIVDCDIKFHTTPIVTITYRLCVSCPPRIRVIRGYDLILGNAVWPRK